MKRLWSAIAFLGVAISAISVVKAQKTTHVAAAASTTEIREVIQKTYYSPDFRRMDWHHPVSLRWPSSHKVNSKDIKRVRTIQSFYIVGDRATLVIDFQDSVSGISPQTHKPVKFQAVDTYQDIWVKRKDKWVLKFAKRLSGDYLIDGKSQRFMLSN